MGSEKKPAKFKLRIDIQCGVCGSLAHLQSEPKTVDPKTASLPPNLSLPKFCPCCGAAMERFCLKCHKRADMYFEEWWPEDEECLRTYSPAKRCPGCNAILEPESPDEDDREFQN